MMEFTHIGIVGAGTMGAALAQKFAQEGFQVVMIDREERFLERGLESIRSTLDAGRERGIFTEEQVDAIMGRVNASTDYASLAPCQLTVEAVFEDLDVKTDVFRRICEAVDESAIVATNTSSFSVSALSRAVARPERFIGLHFFYHAAMNRLVEIVRAESTSDETFQSAMLLMQQCGKDPIICRDVNGFVVNRFFVPWLNESVRLYEEEVAGMADIDAVCRKVFGCGMGPFALMNATGVPIAYHSQQTLHEAFGAFYRPAERLREQMERNEPWSIGEETGVDAAVEERIRRRMLGVVFLVCGQLLDENVCTAGDINRGARIGLRWKHGPAELYHVIGETEVRAMASEIASAWDIDLPSSLNSAAWKQDVLRVDRHDSTGVIVVNRPEDLNAFNPLVASQLSEEFERLEGDPAVGTIVITGQGKAFMAGADIKFFIDHIVAGTLQEIVSFTKAGQELFRRIDDSGKKVVALVNGLALGGGFELALTADVILALKHAVFAFPETGIGIYPGLGGTQRTVKRVGKGLTKYLVYTGDFVSARKALEFGLIDAVVGWRDVPAVFRGNLPAIQERTDLSGYWQGIRDLFEKYPLSQLVDVDFQPETTLDEKTWRGIVKRIRRKAPRALALAERLIDAQEGPESELEHLEEIFSTEDALAGLRSVGGPPPAFSGR